MGTNETNVKKELEISTILMGQLDQMNLIANTILNNQKDSNKLNFKTIIIVVALFVGGITIGGSIFFTQYFKTSYSNEIQQNNTNTNVNTNTNNEE